jgi:hypothetical protein
VFNYTRLGMLVRDKHPSLLDQCVSKKVNEGENGKEKIS